MRQNYPTGIKKKYREINIINSVLDFTFRQPHRLPWRQNITQLGAYTCTLLDSVYAGNKLQAVTAVCGSSQ